MHSLLKRARTVHVSAIPMLRAGDASGDARVVVVAAARKGLVEVEVLPPQTGGVDASAPSEAALSTSDASAAAKVCRCSLPPVNIASRSPYGEGHVAWT